MQIPILSGIYTDEDSDFRTSYPRNLVPVPKDSGISKGYLRPADGIVSRGTGPGIGRGGINWNDVCYRVMGTSLVSVSSDGVASTIGDVGGSGQVSLDYSFDRLAVASSGNFYLWDGSTLQQNTDTDLGYVIDFVWVDGYFMTTDGEFLVVTELGNPFSVNPLKYGSSEVDPDPVKALLKVRNEVYALNRYTGEVFDNIGGDLFPFQRIEGAQLQRGVIGTHACCVFADSVAFLGSGRKESPALWVGSDGSTIKVSTREIDQILSEYTEDQLSGVLLEARVDKNHNHLYVHLPDRTLVYDYAGSQLIGSPVWFTLTTSINGDSQYRAKNMIWCYDEWLVEDPESSSIGYYTDTLSSHWGDVVGWDFGTMIAYNDGNGAIFHELELVCLSGRSELGADPVIYTSYSLDGENWSVERWVKAGKQGERNKRIVWLQQGPMRHWRTQRFWGTSDSMLSMARLEARIEPLAV